MWPWRPGLWRSRNLWRGGRFSWCISDPIRFKTSVKFQDSMAWVRCTFANLLIKLGPHFLSQVTTKEATALPSREMNLIHFPYDYIATFLQIILFVCHTNTFNLWLICDLIHISCKIYRHSDFSLFSYFPGLFFVPPIYLAPVNYCT